MALIQCPECGKENVSSSANVCPSCGYSIREHIERENRKKLYAQQQQELEEKKQTEWNNLQSELNMKLAEIDRLQPSAKPKRPTRFKHMFFYNNELSLFSWALIAVIVLFILSFAVPFLFVLCAIVIVIGLPVTGIITDLDWDIEYKFYKSEYNNWKEQQTDWEHYIEKKKQVVIEEYKKIASNMAIYGTRSIPTFKEQKSNEQLKCPVCGATNIERISTANRSVSIAMVGLASGKIAKQYKCKKCKHMW